MKKKDPYRFAKICVAVMVFIFAAWLGRVFIFRGLGTLITDCLETSNAAIVSATVTFNSNTENKQTLNADEITVFLENLNEIKARKPDIYEYKPFLEKQKQVKYTGKLDDSVTACEVEFFDEDGDTMATLKFQPSQLPVIFYRERERLWSNAYEINDTGATFVLRREISADDIISALP